MQTMGHMEEAALFRETSLTKPTLRCVLSTRQETGGASDELLQRSITFLSGVFADQSLKSQKYDSQSCMIQHWDKRRINNWTHEGGFV